MKIPQRRKLLSSLLVFICLAIPLSASAVEYTVSTVGGGGSGTCTTTPQSALLVGVTAPWGMASDSQGNIYYTDRNSYTVCKITTDGNVVRVAGTGVRALGADNVQATASALYDPIALAVDSTGVLYIAEYAAARSIRRVGLDGVISTILNVAHGSTVANSGELATSASSTGPTGLAISPTGELYYAEYGSSTVSKIDSNGYVQRVAGTGSSGTSGDGGLATAATLTQPSTLVFDQSGNLFISSYSFHVRKVDTSGVITKYAGTYGSNSHSGNGGLATSASFKNLWGLATDGEGNLYIPERLGNTIRKVTASTGIVTTIVGVDGGNSYVDTSTAVARVGNVYSVAFNADGDLYFGDLTNMRIRKVSGIGVMNQSTPLNISHNSLGVLRTSSVITASGGATGKITFFVNGKRIAGCISITYSGSATCNWRPTVRGSVKISAIVLKTGGIQIRSNNLSVAVSGRAIRR